MFKKLKIDKLTISLSKAVLLFAAFILLTVTTAFFSKSLTDVINIMPLYVSLIVVLLQTSANRYAPLLGGINSVFYAVIYVAFKLYSQAAYALLFSFPLQLVTFYNWNKKPYGNSTIFKRLSMKSILGISMLFVIVYAAFCLFFSKIGSSYIMLDNFVTIMGILSSILMFASYIEYAACTLMCGVVTLFLSITMMIDFPERTPYLVFAVYNVICGIMTMVRVAKLHKEQHE